MDIKAIKKSLPIILISAVAAGFCNALIGAGGGILLTLSMEAVIGNRFFDKKQLLVTTQAAMIPCCILSAMIYARSGTLDTANFGIFVLPALLGGGIGSILLDKIKPRLINMIFSALVIFSGIRMMVR